MNVNRRRCAVLFACSVLFTGCAGNPERGLPKSPVSGTVKYKKALPEGQITFQHSSGEMSMVKFGPDGKYNVDVARGPNKVMVVSASSSYTDDKPGAVRSMEVFTSHIPNRYKSFLTSGLEYAVKEGENTFDIELVD